VSRQRRPVNTDMVAALDMRSRPAEDKLASGTPDWAVATVQHRQAGDWRNPHPGRSMRCSPADWRECLSRAFQDIQRDWAPDQIASDDKPLVQQIRTRVLPRRGALARPTRSS
jgi:hypothetical protein